MSPRVKLIVLVAILAALTLPFKFIETKNLNGDTTLVAPSVQAFLEPLSDYPPVMVPLYHASANGAGWKFANDLALIAAPDALSDDLRSFIETHSFQTIENVTFENVAERVFPAVTKLLGVPDAELQQAVKSALTTSVARLDAK